MLTVEETMELLGKLKASQQQAAEFERELTTIKSNIGDFAKSYQELQKGYGELVGTSAKLK